MYARPPLPGILCNMLLWMLFVLCASPWHSTASPWHSAPPPGILPPPPGSLCNTLLWMLFAFGALWANASGAYTSLTPPGRFRECCAVHFLCMHTCRTHLLHTMLCLDASVQVSLQQPAFRATFNLPSPKDLQVWHSCSCLGLPRHEVHSKNCPRVVCVWNLAVHWSCCTDVACML